LTQDFLGTQPVIHHCQGFSPTPELVCVASAIRSRSTSSPLDDRPVLFPGICTQWEGAVGTAWQGRGELLHPAASRNSVILCGWLVNTQ